MANKYYYDGYSSFAYDVRDKPKCLSYYIGQFLNRTRQMFKYSNLPDTIPEYCLERLLQINGFSCIAEHDGKLYAFYGGLGGEPDEYYRPTVCTVSNPALKLSKTYQIDKDCVIVQNDTYLQGLIPLISRYATQLVENDISFDLVVTNLRAMDVFSATDDATYQSATQYLNDLKAGKQGVVASNEFLEGLKVQPTSTSNEGHKLQQLIEYHQYLKGSLFNEIGINSNFNLKREILTSSENNMNVDALLPLAQNMLECRKYGVDKINKMFGTNITVEFNSIWQKLEDIENQLTENDIDEQTIEENKQEEIEDKESDEDET